MTLEHEELTGEIIAAAMAVHKELGPGFAESIYENAMAIKAGDDPRLALSPSWVPGFLRGCTQH